MLLIVVVAWVFFRASSISDAFTVLSGMAGANGPGDFVQARNAAGWIAACLLVVWCMPNTYEVFSRFHPALAVRPDLVRAAPAALDWHPTRVWAVVMAVMFVAGILAMNKFSPFLYFRF